MDERTEDIEVCRDMLKRLEETKQIYIVGLDVPISVTKGLFSLLDEKRREVARQKGIPEEQFDLEDLLGHFVGLTSSKGSPSGEERARDILRRAGYGVGSEPTTERRQKFIEGLNEAVTDEISAETMYDKLAREALALGYSEEAVKLRGISADEHGHWVILDKMLRSLPRRE